MRIQARVKVVTNDTQQRAAVDLRGYGRVEVSFEVDLQFKLKVDLNVPSYTFYRVPII